MNWIQSNLAESLVVLGLALLALEIVVLGFSTFFLFFAGVASIISGTLMYVGAVDATMLNAFLSTAILTAVLAVFMWKPLKKMQNKVETTEVTNDLIGHSFILQDKVSATDNPTYRYSGIDWKLVSVDPLEAGVQVEVVQNEVGIFHIQAK